MATALNKMMKIDNANFRTDVAVRFDAETNKSARISSALGYLFFFIPIIMHPESKFARYHANQGLILLLFMTMGTALLSMVPYAGPFLALVAVVLGIVLALRGMVVALRCQAKRIPLLGKLILIEYEDTYTLEL